MLKAEAEALKGGCNRCFAVCGIETLLFIQLLDGLGGSCNRCFAMCGIETGSSIQLYLMAACVAIGVSLLNFFDFGNSDLG